MQADEGEPAPRALIVRLDGVFCAAWRTMFRAARNRGTHSALLYRRIEEGRAAGVETFGADLILPGPGPQDASASYRNYRRSGFDLAYRRANYGLSPG